MGEVREDKEEKELQLKKKARLQVTAFSLNAYPGNEKKRLANMAGGAVKCRCFNPLDASKLPPMTLDADVERARLRLDKDSLHFVLSFIGSFVHSYRNAYMLAVHTRYSLGTLSVRRF